MPETLTPWTDPELEARVVAFVLGEASDFERDQLQQLLARNADLAAFQKRMEAIHGLLQDALGEPGSAAALAPWQLPAARRQPLLDLLAATPLPAGSAPGPRRSWFARPVFWWSAAAAAACLAVLALPSFSPRYARLVVSTEGETSARHEPFAGEAFRAPAKPQEATEPPPPPAAPAVPSPDVEDAAAASAPAAAPAPDGPPASYALTLNDMDRSPAETPLPPAQPRRESGMPERDLLRKNKVLTDEEVARGDSFAPSAAPLSRSGDVPLGAGAGVGGGGFFDAGRPVVKQENRPEPGFGAVELEEGKQQWRFAGAEARDKSRGLDLFGSIRADGAPAGKDLDVAASVTPQLLESKTIAGTAATARDPEIATADEPFSTFSLHVSDVSFQLARAALREGKWPDPARIRIEEFVNAFDYGDPSPAAAEPVACTLEQAVHPFQQGRNLLRISLRTGALGRGASTPLRLTLLLDSSGSMERADRRETLQAALAQLAGQLKPGDRVSLISFARQPKLVADQLPGDRANALLEIVERTPSEGGTNLEAALSLAGEKAREHFDPAAQNRIVLLTDGAANLGDADPARLAGAVKVLRQEGIAFDIAGIGADGVNDAVLEALSRQGDGRYYLLDSPQHANASFAQQLAGAFRPAARNVKAQVWFNPERVRRYRLLGFDEHRLKTEDFRDDKVDAAELAAAEAGVALFQFEPLPAGAGDAGYVSVRFQDTATGRMVERRWPIPHEPAPPAFAKAPDSLRLAGSAAFLAAKLGDDPLAPVIDLPVLESAVRDPGLRTMIRQARDLSLTR